jgi:hypothetical protein
MGLWRMIAIRWCSPLARAGGRKGSLLGSTLIGCNSHLPLRAPYGGLAAFFVVGGGYGLK